MRGMIILFLIVTMTGFVSSQITIGGGEEVDNVIDLTPPVVTPFSNASFNQSFGDGQWWRLDGGNDPPTANWNMGGFGFDNLGYFSTPQNQFNLTPSDDGSNHFLTSDVGGANYLSLETSGAFFQLYANPNPSNDNLLATITETQGADTQLNFYEGGTGHNRFWDSGSARIGGGASRFCSNLTTDVDCDTPATGADLVVQDDIWAGGKLFSSDWTNVSVTESQISDLSHFVNTNVAYLNNTQTFTAEQNTFEEEVIVGTSATALINMSKRVVSSLGLIGPYISGKFFFGTQNLVFMERGLFLYPSSIGNFQTQLFFANRTDPAGTYYSFRHDDTTGKMELFCQNWADCVFHNQMDLQVAGDLNVTDKTKLSDDVRIEGNLNVTGQVIEISSFEMTLPRTGASVYYDFGDATCGGAKCWTAPHAGSIVDGISLLEGITSSGGTSYNNASIRINGVEQFKVTHAHSSAVTLSSNTTSKARGEINFTQGQTISCYHEHDGTAWLQYTGGCSIGLIYNNV